MIAGTEAWAMLAAAALAAPAWAQVSYVSGRYLYIEQLADILGSSWEADTGSTFFVCNGCNVVAVADDTQRVALMFVYIDGAKNRDEERAKIKQTAEKLAGLFDVPAKPKITYSQDAPSALLTYTILFNQAKERNAGLLNTERLPVLYYVMNSCSGTLRGWHDGGVSFWVTKNSMRFEVTLDMLHDPVEYVELRLAAEQSAKFERSSQNVKELVTGNPHGGGNPQLRNDLTRELNASRLVLSDTDEDAYITWKAKVFRAGTEERLKAANKKGRTARDYVFGEIEFPKREATLPGVPLSVSRKAKQNNAGGSPADEEEEAADRAGDPLGSPAMPADNEPQQAGEQGEADGGDGQGSDASADTGRKPAAQPQPTPQPLTPQEAMEAYIKQLHDLAGQ